MSLCLLLRSVGGDRQHAERDEDECHLFRAHFHFYAQGVPTREILGIQTGWVSQNPNLRRRASPGVRRGHPAGRPGPTRRLLSALRGVLLPFRHGFDDKRNRLFDGVMLEGGPTSRSGCMLK